MQSNISSSLSNLIFKVDPLKCRRTFNLHDTWSFQSKTLINPSPKAKMKQNKTTDKTYVIVTCLPNRPPTILSPIRTPSHCFLGRTGNWKASWTSRASYHVMVTWGRFSWPCAMSSATVCSLAATLQSTCLSTRMTTSCRRRKYQHCIESVSRSMWEWMSSPPIYS